MLDFEYERLDVMVEAEIPTAADAADDVAAVAVAIDGGSGDAAAEPPLLPYGSAGEGPVGGATTIEDVPLPPLPGADGAEAATAAATLPAPL